MSLTGAQSRIEFRQLSGTPGQQDRGLVASAPQLVTPVGQHFNQLVQFAFRAKVYLHHRWINPARRSLSMKVRCANPATPPDDDLFE